MRDFILSFARECGYKHKTDKAGNILCYQRKRDIALQSHYDMVCVGKAPNIEIIERDGFLSAKNSSLGADNGIGVSLMLWLMKNGYEAEYLFTNDEEIGLLGASKISLNIKSKYLINLDSEKSGEIFVGCAGGIIFKGFKEAKFEEIKKRDIYLLETIVFEGGHSGLDIDRGIPNAIIVLCGFLSNFPEAKLLFFNGGDKINSIPTKARAIISAPKKPIGNEFVKVRKLNSKKFFVLKDSFELIDFVLKIPNGVLEYLDEFKIPSLSNNISKLKVSKEKIEIVSFLRGMDKREMNEEKKRFFELFENQGYFIATEGEFEPWEIEIDSFSLKIKDILRKFFRNVNFKAIHAGLEVGVLKKKFPSLKAVSLGADIFYPHSVNEKVSISSVEKMQEVLPLVLSEFS